MALFKPPGLPGASLQGIRDYLYQLSESLNYAINTLDNGKGAGGTVIERQTMKFPQATGFDYSTAGQISVTADGTVYVYRWEQDEAGNLTGVLEPDGNRRTITGAEPFPGVAVGIVVALDLIRRMNDDGI